MTIEYNGTYFKQIRKDVAKNYYNNGRSIYAMPCKMRPCRSWGGPNWWNKEYNDGKPFDTLYNEYSYYNCNSETGRYIHFYIMVNPSGVPILD